MQLDPHAPVSHTASIGMSAPVEKVWGLMSEIEKWPEWNKDVTSAHLNGELAPGTAFTWKAGPGTITSTLQAVEPGKLIAWSGKTMGIKAVHIWRLAAEGNATLVTTEESWSGLLARLLKGYSQKTLQRAVNTGLKLLKTAAESGTSTSVL